MEINDAWMPNGEKLTLLLRALYHAHGYRPYRMSKFEEYDFYAGNKDFLVSDNVLTFTDTDGTLMALKPDVTLSIIKNSKDLPDRLQRVYYVENVYRVSRDSGSFREIMQTGLECFGAVTKANLLEVLELAAQSLRKLSPTGILCISDLKLLETLLSPLKLNRQEEQTLYEAIGQKNMGAIAAVTGPGPIFALLEKLLSIHAAPAAGAETLEALLPQSPERDAFCNTLRLLAAGCWAEAVRVDFSTVDDIHYYNGVVMKGFVSGIPEAVLSGGQYDRLMERMKRRSRAVGFAVYTDLLERLDLNADTEAAPDDYLNVALPKGRLGERVYAMFAEAGFECPSILDQNRKLVFENPEKKVRYFWVKPSDVAIYVERGAADLGVAGKDILMEYEPEVYELLDLHTGVCRMAVAAPESFRDDPGRTLRVATKFSSIATRYYRSQGREVDLIHLNGSIELAPLLGLSDVIVDIVETGATLKENHLHVVDTVAPISARLIANKASYKFKRKQIDTIAANMGRLLEENK